MVGQLYLDYDYDYDEHGIATLFVQILIPQSWRIQRPKMRQPKSALSST